MKALMTDPLRKLFFAALMYIAGAGLVRAQSCTIVVAATNSLSGNGTMIFSATTTPASSVVLNWSFPGGNPSTSTLSSPVVNYSVNGTYTAFVVMTVTSTACTNAAQYVFAVNNASCNLVANFTYSNGPNGLVTFANSSTGAGGSTTYTWSNASMGPTTAINYSVNGNYTVSMIASNGPTCASSHSAVVSVTNVCTIAANFTQTPGSNGFVQFFNTTTNTVSGTTYTWNFGDASPVSTSVNPSHTYTANGAYTVYLLASTPSGCTSQVSYVIGVNSIGGCLADFTHTVTGGTVAFTNISFNSGTLIGFSWNFGDGQTSTLTNPPPHTYTALGNFSVSLKITSVGPSCSDSVTHVVTVSCNIVPSFTYSASPSGSVTFFSTSSGGQQGNIYSWNFGNNTTGSGAQATTTYTAPGIYNVTLTVMLTATSTCSAVVVQSISIGATPCTLQSAIAHTLGTGGGIQFASASTGTIPSSQYYWDFGDGYTGTGLKPWHNYTNGGTHYVTLVVVNQPACTSTITQALNVTGVACTANAGFTLIPQSGPGGWYVVPDYPWNVIAATWIWGDGASSAGLYSTHQYSLPGTYNICLSVTVSCAATGSGCATYVLTGTGPQSAVVVAPGLRAAGIAGLQETPGFDVIPNPSSGVFIIASRSPAGTPWRASIFDLNGRCVAQRVADPNDQQTEVSVDSGDGLYFLRIECGTTVNTRKIIISR
jgi:PKD repeat protein